jgi:hypothetical protein
MYVTGFPMGIRCAEPFHEHFFLALTAIRLEDDDIDPHSLMIFRVDKGRCRTRGLPLGGATYII